MGMQASCSGCVLQRHRIGVSESLGPWQSRSDGAFNDKIVAWSYALLPHKSQKVATKHSVSTPVKNSPCRPRAPHSLCGADEEGAAHLSTAGSIGSVAQMPPEFASTASHPIPHAALNTLVSPRARVREIVWSSDGLRGLSVHERHTGSSRGASDSALLPARPFRVSRSCRFSSSACPPPCLLFLVYRHPAYAHTTPGHEHTCLRNCHTPRTRRISFNELEVPPSSTLRCCACGGPDCPLHRS